MHAEFTFQLATLYGFLLALARVSGVVVFVPIPGFSAGPDASRVVLVLALTIALFPSWPTLAAEDGQALVVGRLLGSDLRGNTFRSHGGARHRFSAGRRADGGPSVGIAGWIFLRVHGRPHARKPTPPRSSSWRSFSRACFSSPSDSTARCSRPWRGVWNRRQDGAFALDGHAIEAMVRLGAAIFTTGIQLAIPVLALLVLLDIAFAVLGRLHAQMQTSLALLCDQDADGAGLSCRRALSVSGGLRARRRDHVRVLDRVLNR